MAMGLPFPEPLHPGSIPTALAPMQDVTDLAFMKLLGKYGAPDYFFTEYFRVHEHSTLDAHILESILHHGTGRPVFAQLIGEDLHHLRRTALALQKYPVAGIDLNMGCPAPKIYRKNVGGGLLREPDSIDRILGVLRECCEGRFTVKTRIGFEDDRHFARILGLVEKHNVDALSIHGRTVRQMYRGEVDYQWIAKAAETVPCPVFANGNITSCAKAKAVYRQTGCFGIMIGRSAIRNPWIFRQVRESSLGRSVFLPALCHVREYIDDLWAMTSRPGLPEVHQLNRMKKFLNFVGQAVDPEGAFLHKMRRAREPKDFFGVCDDFLLREGNDQRPFPMEPYCGVHARPNHEGEQRPQACGL